MKEFKKSNTITYNLMSFTAFKSLMLFTLLLESPKSYHEICEFFKNHEYIKEEISIDTFRVYITSLKRSGCEIVRTSSKEGSKYKIISHPFEFKISREQIKSILKIYRIITETVDLKDLFVFEKFARNLAVRTKNDELAAAVDKISLFKGIDFLLLEELFKYADNKRQIRFLYNSPKGKKIEVELVIDKLDILNNKIYLFGTNINYKEYSYFKVSRILKIINVSLNTIDFGKVTPFKVKYELKSLAPEFKLSNDEKILAIRDDSIIVEMEALNKFILKQKIMSYGNYCTVLEPADFREDIISTLKRMREEYCSGKD